MRRAFFGSGPASFMAGSRMLWRRESRAGRAASHHVQPGAAAIAVRALFLMSPGGLLRRLHLEAALDALGLQHLGDQEGELERLAAVQARIAVGVVAAR